MCFTLYAKNAVQLLGKGKCFTLYAKNAVQLLGKGKCFTLYAKNAVAQIFKTFQKLQDFSPAKKKHKRFCTCARKCKIRQKTYTRYFQFEESQTKSGNFRVFPCLWY